MRLAAAVLCLCAALLGGCANGKETAISQTSRPAPPAGQQVDYSARPFCGLHPGSYNRPGANAYADALIEENRQFQGFEDMERTEEPDLSRIRERLTVERAQLASFIHDVQALPVAPVNARLVDALLNAKQQELKVLDAELAAPTIHEINVWQARSDGVVAASSSASGDLRRALDLPATKCQYLF